MNVDFKDQLSCKAAILKAQTDQRDQREEARECSIFLNKKNGMWEADIYNKMKGRPRYQFDMISPVIDNIVGGFEQTVFNAKVSATRGGDKQGVKIRQGLLRSIQNWSDAHIIYKNMGRKYMVEGFAAFCVDYDYLDQDTFDKDLLLKEIKGAIDRVWLDPGSEKQDGSDANWSCEVQSLIHDDFVKKFEGKDPASFDTGHAYDAFDSKRTVINIVKFYYREAVERELILMSDNSVYEADEYERLKEGLALQGLAEVKRRKRKSYKVKCRYMSGTEWLTEAFDTPFEYQPIIPVYNQFDIIEDKIVWNRPVQKMMDSQRVINYSKSREVEEGALAPRQKQWLTPAQVKGHTKTISTLNTNPDPVQLYNPDKNIQNQIVTTGGAQINPSLVNIYTGAQQNIEQTSGMFAASMGKNPNDQSGEALKVLEARGDMGNSSIYKDMEIAITHAMRILIKAFPDVYDSEREIPITEESGEVSIESINKSQMQLTQAGAEAIIINDLSDASYDCTVEMSATYRTQQEEANNAILAAAELDPAILQTSMDIFLSNINAAGIDQIQERVRSSMFKNGQIPIEQMTDEERQQAEQQAAQQQEQPPLEAQILLMQEQTKQMQAQQAMLKEQNMAQANEIKAYQAQTGAQNDQANTMLKQADVETKRMEAMIKAEQAGASISNTEMDTVKKGVESQLMQADIAEKQLDMDIKNLPTEELVRMMQL